MGLSKGFNEWCGRLFPEQNHQIVYVFKDAAGSVLYVGRTSEVRFFVRMKEHYSKGGGGGGSYLPWITDVFECEIHKRNTIKEAMEYERALICEHKPIFNIQNNEREFFQYHGRFTRDLQPVETNFGWKRDGNKGWIKP